MQVWDSVGIWPCGPLPAPCGGPMHEHGTDAMWLEATMSFAIRGSGLKRAWSGPSYDKRHDLAVAASVPFVIPSGFEPETHSLEGCCSIQLSYGTMLSQKGLQR